MRLTRGILAMAMVGSVSMGARGADPDYAIQPVLSKAVKVEGGFWGAKIETNRVSTIPHLLKMNDENERLNNLRRGAGLLPGPYVSRRYNDTDVYKLLEAVGYSLAMHPDPALEKIADEQIEILAKAQEPDGYIYPARMKDPKDSAAGVGAERWSREGGSHELYNQGHFIEAGIAYSQATGKRKFLEMAIKCGDMLCNTFGPDRRHDTSGHEEIELALVKLFRATGDRKYVALAQFFIDQRGQKHTFGDYAGDAPAGFNMYNDRAYRQDDKPVIEQTVATGHAVRAAYLYCGVTDIAALTGQAEYRIAIDRLWENVAGTQMYVTGGIGSTGGTEAFGGDYYLPNNAYCETCAQIGFALWNQRMFMLHGEAKYLDVAERVIYNGLLSGVSLKGDTFFYQNPLQNNAARGGRGRRGGAAAGPAAATGPATANAAELGGTGVSAAASGPRQGWFDVACCPANLARYVAQFAGYIYATRGDVIYVDYFVDSAADVTVNGSKVHLKQETKFPLDGDLKLTVTPEAAGEFTLNVRIPCWSQDKSLPTDLYTFIPQPKSHLPETYWIKVNGQTITPEMKDGFASLRRPWKPGDTVEVHLPMEARQVVAHEKVEADRGLVAIQRGPLIYCIEGADNSPAGGALPAITLGADTAFSTEAKPELLGGVTLVKLKTSDREFTAVPYYAWGNRGNGEMRVWLARAQ
ncbi:MAG TPA: beta-L-arabinofuranosidase domain-containing protein [Phycisphaerae bacterium]|nr:beta-L-arabinofuranosidase domain-containing protein [Phycisphaerae bacterium]